MDVLLRHDSAGKDDKGQWQTYRYQLEVLELIAAASTTEGLVNSCSANTVGYVDQSRQLLQLREELGADCEIVVVRVSERCLRLDNGTKSDMNKD